MSVLSNTVRSTSSALLVASCGIVIVNLSAWLYRKVRITRGLRKVAKRKENHWLLGELPDAVKHRHAYLDWKTGVLNELGPTMACPPTLFIDGFIVSTRPDFVEHILNKRFENYIKPPRLISAFKPIFGNSIFTLNHAHIADGGALWRLQRQTAIKVFTANRFRQYCAEVFSRHFKNMAVKLEAASANAEIVDMQRLFQGFTMHSIFNIGMGCELEPEDFARFTSSFDIANQLCVLRLQRPWYPYFGWLMSSEWELAHHIAEVNALANATVNRRLEESEELAEKGDILSQFLKARAEHHELNDRGLLRDIVVGFIGAGRDTTTALMTWATHDILAHPEVKARLLAEIDGLDLSSPPSYDTLKSLRFLDAVLHESMRLHAPVPWDAKFAVQDDELPDGTFVPGGCEVQFTPWAMGRSERLWANPLEFDPDRWLSGTRPSAFAFPVFQAGPRVCIGQTFALTEAKAGLVALFHDFDLQLCSAQPPAYDLSFVLVMKGGLPVRVSARTRPT